jgi:LPS O-antigen subunit length determinant protein (WzzB/FepE family)
MGQAKRRGSKEERVEQAEPKGETLAHRRNVKFTSPQAHAASMALIGALNFAPIKIKTQGPPKKRAF